VREAASKGVALETAAAALAVFQQAIAEGHGDEDFSAVSKSAKRLAHS
jgi:3-hydroxyisobutyrate dehydrogenase-like beta-hydroxyacid dehydrogenase